MKAMFVSPENHFCCSSTGIDELMMTGIDAVSGATLRFSTAAGRS